MRPVRSRPLSLAAGCRPSVEPPPHPTTAARLRQRKSALALQGETDPVSISENPRPYSLHIPLRRLGSLPSCSLRGVGNLHLNLHRRRRDRRWGGLGVLEGSEQSLRLGDREVAGLLLLPM